MGYPREWLPSSSASLKIQRPERITDRRTTSDWWTRMSIYWKRHELRDWSRNLWWLMERSKPRRDSLSRCRHKPKWCMCKLNHNRCRAKLRWFMSKGNHQHSTATTVRRGIYEGRFCEGILRRIFMKK